MKECKHGRVVDGPDIPLRHGSASCVICLDCGMWRMKDWHHEFHEWWPWRGDSIHEQTIEGEEY
jgi:hypothetical protein